MRTLSKGALLAAAEVAEAWTSDVNSYFADDYLAADVNIAIPAGAPW